MSITSIASKILNDEWMEIKYIGEDEPEFIRPPLVGENWTCTPSGRICAHYWTFCSEQNECCYVITFVDLVDKVCFEIKLIYGQEFENDVDNLQLDSFYFTSEDELVIVAGYMGLVKQLIYKVDYLAQKLVLKETIAHSFLARLDFISGFMAPQHHKFVRYDGIDYILMVSFNEDPMPDNVRDCIYTIYMIPKDASNRKAPVKEYQIHLTKEDRTHIKNKINANLTSISNMFDIIFTIDECSSLINGTKLTFHLKLVGLNDNGEFLDEIRLGTLIGAHWEIDLTKLTDISERKIYNAEDVEQLRKEQGNCYNFVQQGDMRIADWVHLQCYEQGVGLVNVIDNELIHSDGPNSALVYPSTMTEYSKPINLDCEIEFENGEHRYALHPQGALLDFKFPMEGSSILLRVLKCLKPNLTSLAFNKALFNCNVPLKARIIPSTITRMVISALKRYNISTLHNDYCYKKIGEVTKEPS